MLKVTREMCLELSSSEPPDFSCVPLQLGMRKDPWRVAIASMLLCRTRRRQAEPVLRHLLMVYPGAVHLAVAYDNVVAGLVQPCGFHRNRARQLIRFSGQYIDTKWTYLKDLAGVGKYVHDAVGLFCFGCAELESDDSVLADYAKELTCRTLNQHTTTESGS